MQEVKDTLLDIGYYALYWSKTKTETNAQHCDQSPKVWRTVQVVEYSLFCTQP